jgi:hypothetical protein
MPQKSNEWEQNPAGSPVPQDRDDELEMAEDEDFEDDEDIDEEDETDDEGVEEE